MKIFDPESLKKWDHFTIQHEPVSSTDLMFRASKNLFREIIRIIPPDIKIIIVCGSGNNGGDGFCLASMFRDAFYPVELWYCPVSSQTAENRFYAEKVKATEEITFLEIHPMSSLPIVPEEAYIIDALMGYSFRGPWRNGWENLIHTINRLPNKKIAIDLPSGMSDVNISDNVCIQADYTLTIQTPKRCFFYEKNIESVGILKVVPIGLDENFYQKTHTGFHTIDKDTVAGLTRKRKKTDQKWTFGHAALIAGHVTMPGAAILSSKACVRGGAGLTTVFIPEAVFPVVASAVPEAMYQFTGEKKWEKPIHVPSRATALGIGPGLGYETETTSQVVILLSENPQLPKVIDADALNIMAAAGIEKYSYLQHAILTPHVKEFERLFGQTENQEALEKIALQQAFELQSVIILKGPFTRVCCPDGSVYYNTTGNPGMAKGGAGDVLTGLLTGLLAQGYSLVDAALIGVFLHGMAGDLAEAKEGENSMLASDIIENIGASFQKTCSHEQ